VVVWRITSPLKNPSATHTQTHRMGLQEMPVTRLAGMFVNVKDGYQMATERNEDEAHYYGTLAWFVYWILELGPLRVYRDVNEILNTELMSRIEEGSWNDKQLLKFIQEIEAYSREESTTNILY
jgi:hypothetical protein